MTDPNAPAGGAPPPPSYPPPTAPQPGYPQPTGYQQYPYQQYGYAYGAPPMIVRNNGMAIASLVCGVSALFAWFFVVPQVLAVVFGHVGLGQIRRSGGQERGEGMAIAGLILGYLALIGAIAFWIAVANSDTSTTTY